MDNVFVDWHRLPPNAVEFVVHLGDRERPNTMRVGEHVLASDGELHREAVVVALDRDTATLRIVEYHPPVDVTSVRVLEDTTVEVGFDDGATRVRDLGPLLHGPVFQQVRDDPAVFAEVVVDPASGTITWPGTEADIDPELLHHDDLWALGPAPPPTSNDPTTTGAPPGSPAAADDHPSR